MVWDMVISMMTEKDFWDKFNARHNPKYHHAKKKNTKRKQKNKKIIPLNLKSLGNEIEAYPFVAIEWSDIEGDAGWSSTKDLNKEKLPTCVSRGYLLSQAKGVTRIFTDYIKTKDKPTFDNIGNTTIIPTSVIISIKKLN
jgi:hypothetical protein